MNKIFICLAGLALSACDLGLGTSYDPTTKTLYVDYYQEACNETTTELCFRTRLDTADSFVTSSIGMTGFDDLQWGSRYTVQVEAERDSSGADVHYSLNSIDQVDVIDASSNSFLLTFSMASQILLDNQNNSWTIGGAKTFSCTDADCAILEKSYLDAEKVQLNFSAEDNELTLLAVKCTSSETSFSAECDGVNDAIWDIAHYRSDCGMPEPKLCLVYKDANDSSTAWNVLGFEITGFSSLWGEQYNVDVKVKIEGRDLKSASLTEENSRNTDQLNNTFKMVMRTGKLGLEESVNDVITYDGIAFNCAINNQCANINAAVAKASSSQDRFLILEAFVETSAEIPVVIINDLVCDAGGSEQFKTTCISENDDVYWIE